MNNDSTVLFVSHVNPALRSGGNEVRILKMIQWLKSEGMTVVLLLNRPALSAETEKRVLALVDHVHTPDRCAAPVHRKIRNAAKRWFAGKKTPETESEKIRANLGSDYLGQATGILCRRYSPKAVVAEYVFATPCLREVPPGVLKIVDTHGVFSRRRPEDPTYCSPEEERSYLLNADVVLAIQEEEADCFRSMVPERRVVTVGVDYEIVDKGPTGGRPRNTVMVVGTNYPANVAGLKGFCEHAWPIVRRENPLAELLVAGKIREAIDTDIPRVKVLGWVDDLQDLYRLSSVVINPTMTGVGLKIKTVEALCNGMALVATPNAVEGLPIRDGETPCMVCGSWPEFAAGVVSLLESGERRRSLQESALRFAREHFAAEKVYGPLKEVLRDAAAGGAG